MRPPGLREDLSAPSASSASAACLPSRSRRVHRSAESWRGPIATPSVEITILAIDIVVARHDLRIRADRHLASAAEPIDNGAFGSQRHRALASSMALIEFSRSMHRPRRISTAMMPWPGAGTQSSTGNSAEMRAPRSRRRSPAAASTSAS